MIKVTVGEEKTQSEKPFPKLMKDDDGAIYYFVRDGYGLPIANWDTENWKDWSEVTATGNRFKLTDYNEPITLQNA